MKLTNVKHKFRLEGVMTYNQPIFRRFGGGVLVLVTFVFLAPYIAIIIQSFGTIWAYDWLPREFYSCQLYYRFERF